VTLAAQYFEIGYLDTLSYKQTSIHCLDPRVKVLVTLCFIVVVVSFPKYELTGLIPLVFFPVMLMSLAGLPFGLIFKKVVAVSPFAIFVGILNPFFDQHIVAHFGPLALTGGWLSFASILVRFVLTVSAALVLIATTSFPGVCFALDKLKAPRALVLQLLFLYRFMFVLMDEAHRMVRSRDMRAFGGRGTGLRVYVRLLGVLFLRSLDRAQRIHQAMSSRAFSGHFYVPRQSQAGYRDVLFFLLWPAFFLVCRFNNVSEIVGTAVLRLAGMN
jgi:cobalt/nickel transport system permease protein